MPQHRFDTDTGCRVGGDDHAEVQLDAAWNVDGRVLNGGYLQAVTARAAVALLGQAGDPVAVSSSFAAPAVPGPAQVHVQVLRRGRRLSAVTATLRQAEVSVLAALVTVGSLPPHARGRVGTAPTADPAVEVGRAADADLARATSIPGAAPSMPAVPAMEDCLRIPADRMPGPPGLAELVDVAFIPERSAWLTGDTSAGPAIQCWMSFPDGRPIDPLALTALVDMAPPASFAQGRFGWAPTLHLQVALFAQPRGRRLLLDLRGEPYDGAFVVEDGLIWDTDGVLVARSRQIAVPPRS